MFVTHVFRDRVISKAGISAKYVAEFTNFVVRVVQWIAARNGKPEIQVRNSSGVSLYSLSEKYAWVWYEYLFSLLCYMLNGRVVCVVRA